MLVHALVRCTRFGFIFYNHTNNGIDSQRVGDRRRRKWLQIMQLIATLSAGPVLTLCKHWTTANSFPSDSLELFAFRGSSTRTIFSCFVFTFRGHVMFHALGHRTKRSTDFSSSAKFFTLPRLSNARAASYGGSIQMRSPIKWRRKAIKTFYYLSSPSSQVITLWRMEIN